MRINLIIIILIIFSSCHFFESKSANYQNGEHKEIKLQVYQNKINAFQIQYPIEFNVVEDEDALFQAKSQINSGNHITIFRFERDEIGVGLDAYIREVFEYVRELENQSDTITILNYLGTELHFKEKIAYYSVLDYIQKDKDIFALTFFIEDNGVIYDFKYRFEFRDNLKEIESTFWKIIYSFQYDGKPLVLKNDFKVIRKSPLSIP